MLNFEEEKSITQIMGRKIGFLVALLIFFSILIFILYKFHVIFITWEAYLASLVFIILIYIFVLTIKSKKKGK